MSAYSTIRITETTARRLVMSKILTYTREELKEIADTILSEKLLNCEIVPDGSDNDEELL